LDLTPALPPETYRPLWRTLIGDKSALHGVFATHSCNHGRNSAYWDPSGGGFRILLDAGGGHWLPPA
jgi:hypothetical protein